MYDIIKIELIRKGGHMSIREQIQHQVENVDFEDVCPHLIKDYPDKVNERIYEFLKEYRVDTSEVDISHFKEGRGEDYQIYDVHYTVSTDMITEMQTEKAYQSGNPQRYVDNELTKYLAGYVDFVVWVDPAKTNIVSIPLLREEIEDFIDTCNPSDLEQYLIKTGGIISEIQEDLQHKGYKPEQVNPIDILVGELNRDYEIRAYYGHGMNVFLRMLKNHLHEKEMNIADYLNQDSQKILSDLERYEAITIEVSVNESTIQDTSESQNNDDMSKEKMVEKLTEIYNDLDETEIKNQIRETQYGLKDKLENQLWDDGVDVILENINDIAFEIENIQYLFSPEDLAEATVDFAYDVGLNRYIQEELYDDLMANIEYDVKISYSNSEIITPQSVTIALEESANEDREVYRDFVEENMQEEIEETYVDKMTSEGINIEDAEHAFQEAKSGCGTHPYDIVIKNIDAPAIADWVYEHRFKDTERSLQAYCESTELTEDCCLHDGIIDWDVKIKGSIDPEEF